MKQYRNRVKEILQDYPVDEIQPCPWNWREHPDAQVAALETSLDQLGIITAMIARRRPDKQLEAIDGHLRKKTLHGQKMTVLVLDLVTEDECKQALLNIDPIAGMARAHQQKLAALREQMKTQAPELRKKLEALAGLREKNKETIVRQQFYAVIECDQEATQKAILEELLNHDLNVRAVCVGFNNAPRKADAPEPEAIAIKGKTIVREVAVKRTARILQLEGQFDLEPTKKIRQSWQVNLKLDQPWQVGLIVGPSGSGKSTIARELWGDLVKERCEWPTDKAIIDAFPAAMSIDQITELLSSVGFSSPPSWRKPYQVLSNGERFRVDLARLLAEAPELAVMDEFTSVIDRQVAQIGAAAVAKTVRNTGRRFVAVTCHNDVEAWLTPDWVYDVATGKQDWRAKRRRPEISIQIRRSSPDAWPRYAPHHYLSRNIHRAAKCFEATVNGQPAAFLAFMNTVSQHPYYGIHRVVCLPDFQGVGIGSATLNYLAGCAAAIDGRPVRITTSHPGLISTLERSTVWRLEKAPSLNLKTHMGIGTLKTSSSIMRPTAGYKYIGPLQQQGAQQLGLIEFPSEKNCTQEVSKGSSPS